MKRFEISLRRGLSYYYYYTLCKYVVLVGTAVNPPVSGRGSRVGHMDQSQDSTKITGGGGG